MPSASEVQHQPDQNRYVLATDHGQALAVYDLRDGVRVFVHTEVPREAEGQGIGTALVRGALDDVRENGWTMVPQCPFVAHFVEENPGYADLVPAA